MKCEVKFKILLDGSWTDWMTAEEIRKYEFSECIMEETMTRAEYDMIYTHPMENDKMTDKFKCVECGENEVDDEDDVCEQCWQEEQEGDNE